MSHSRIHLICSVLKRIKICPFLNNDENFSFEGFTKTFFELCQCHITNFTKRHLTYPEMYIHVLSILLFKSAFYYGMSVFLSWFIENESERGTVKLHKPRSGSRAIFCSALRFIPHEPRKKTTHTLYMYL